ncbi:Uncharacterised protein [BD1-7 clade bacterium]|uniref:DUF4124 domain-containing protein n=1 Tax=BD1-7 clade bacterium TaxID=2029982 RepID=A0A5S9PWM8_9GAMM|nr:Uncharacterised protein [BD1-7 clade bacterium]
MIRSFLLILIVLCSQLPLSAQAQDVFRCRGPGGVAVFQATPCKDLDEAAVRGPSRDMVLEMRRLANKGRAIIADLGADVNSIKRCQKSMVPFVREVSAIKTQVMTLAAESREFKNGYAALEDCAQCRAAASSYCRQVDQHMDRVMMTLMQF